MRIVVVQLLFECGLYEFVFESFAKIFEVLKKITKTLI
jgi:hypothetical protein